MRIFFSKSEEDLIKKIVPFLPGSTLLFEENSFEYEIKEGNLVMIKDSQDWRRIDFKEDEIQPEITKESLVDWWMNIYNPAKEDDHPMRIYHLYHNKIYDFFKYISLSGYWIETSQQIISLKCEKKVDPNEILGELNCFLPFIKPVSGMKRVNLFDYTLSEYGILTLGQEIGRASCRERV